MKKPHCDNCDALIVKDVQSDHRITVQPHGFNCHLSIKVEKHMGQPAGWQPQELCRVCVVSALTEVLKSIDPSLVEKQV